MIDPIIAAARRVRVWGPVITQFTAFQILFQLVSAVAGLIFVRTLGKSDYALLTIGNTWLGAFVNLSNCGVSSATMAFGGRVWQDSDRLARVVSSSLTIRKWLVGLILVPLSLALLWNLRLGGAGYFSAFIIGLFVLAAAAFQISSGILTVVPRLHGEIRQLQRIDGVNAFTRLALTLGAALLYLDLFVAMAISTFGSLLQFLMVRKVAATRIDFDAPSDPVVVAEIRKVVNRQWLNEVNGVFQGQISVMLLSLFATTAAVADFGALGRIAIIFAAFVATLQTVVLPRYARCQDPGRLRALYTQIMISYSIVVLTPFLATLLFPEPFLWLLGPKYAALSRELPLAMLGTGIAALAALAWMLNTARAWIIPGLILVPITLLAQVILIAVIGVSTLREVLLFGIGTNTAILFINVGATLFFSKGFSRV